MRIISRNVHRTNRFERRLAVMRHLRKKYPHTKGAWHLTEYQYLDI